MKTRSLGLPGMLIAGSMLSGAIALGAATECPRRAFCDYHKEYADYEGEDDHAGGVHYRVYVHSLTQRGDDGAQKHKIRVKCENKAESCTDRAWCDYHKENGTYSGEDQYIDGLHYRVYVHSVAELDEDGKFKKHKFIIRCD